MKILIGGVLTLLLVWPALGAQDDPKVKPKEPANGGPATPRQQFNEIMKEWQIAQSAYFKAVQAAKTPEQQQKAYEEIYPKPEKYVPRFVDLAEKNAKDPVAFDALLWVMNNRFGPSGGKDVKTSQSKASAQLLRDHVENPRLGQVCQGMSYSFDPQSQQFLRKVLEKSPHSDVQAEACLALAQSLSQQKGIVQQLKNFPQMAKQLEGMMSKQEVEALLKTDPAKLDSDTDELYLQIAEKHAPKMKADRLVNLCMTLARNSGQGSERVLRTLLEKGGASEVQGPACLALAQALKQRADNLSSAKNSKAAEKIFAESEALFDRAAKDFADIKFGYYGTVGKKAKSELYELRYLTVGKEAPDVEGEDQDGIKFKLSDYRGKVVFLDFWSQF